VPNQRYAVIQPPIDHIFTWIKSGEIAIPEIQRPFVWRAEKVRNFLASLFQGYPVGFLIAWRNPNVKLKDGTPSVGRRILTGRPLAGGVEQASGHRQARRDGPFRGVR
jgi:hypothetical protein